MQAASIFSVPGYLPVRVLQAMQPQLGAEPLGVVSDVPQESVESVANALGTITA